MTDNDTVRTKIAEDVAERILRNYDIPAAVQALVVSDGSSTLRDGLCAMVMEILLPEDENLDQADVEELTAFVTPYTADALDIRRHN
jgi:hypothetical protein